MLIAWLFPVVLFAALAMVVFAATRWQAAAWALLPLFGLPFVLTAALSWVEIGPLSWARIITLLAIVCALNASRFTPLRNTGLGRWVLWALLAIHIGEAVVQDLAQGMWLNAAVGIGLVLTLGSARPIGAQPGGAHPVQWALPWPWILAYSAWNLAFTTNVYALHATDHLAHLGMPLLWAAVLGTKHWFQARGYSLAVYGLAIVTWIDGLGLPWPEPIVQAPPEFAWVMAGVAAGGLVIHLVIGISRWWERWGLADIETSG